MNTTDKEKAEEIFARLFEQCDYDPDFHGHREVNKWSEVMPLAVEKLPEDEFLLLMRLADRTCSEFWEYCPGLLWDIHSSYSLDTLVEAPRMADECGSLIPDYGEAFPIMAAGWNEPELIRRLVEEVKVSVDAYCESDIFESTGSMLSMAARAGCVDICKYLLDMGADPKGEMLEGITCPLAEAVVGNHVEIARLLLKRGASLCNLSYCYDPFAPIDYALENGHQDMVELLKSFSEQ